ncbi:MAG: MEDS domain-containing protein [Nitrospirota bacterium]|nr:MEDS domain-containing protein [Nitrospirota bacterium]
MSEENVLMEKIITPPHFVRFYNDVACLAKEVSHFIGVGLEAGHAGVVIATPSLLEALDQRLSARGCDVTAARDRGQYVALDAAHTLSQFMVDGWPDKDQFFNVVGEVMAGAGNNYAWTRAFGEMVALLVADNKSEAAVRLEQLWNSLGKTYFFSLFCAYPMASFDVQTTNNRFQDICAEHAPVLPVEY